MKTLYVLVSNGGDGSYYPQYTFDREALDRYERCYDEGLVDYEDMGIDGDGLHYDVISVPDECTYESMGITDCFEGYEFPETEDELPPEEREQL